MKNKLTDLHNHLFEQLEFLGDRDIKGEALTEEIRRADTMCKVAGQIIANGNLALNAIKTSDNAIGKIKLPPMLTE
ncbi:MAG: hypothetical protein FWG29_01865 [Treponema sp.]|nr:hypothetical protein [Treponema sp.]